jgi:hypothetical protein
MVESREASLKYINMQIESFKKNYGTTNGTIGMHLKKYVLENNENFILINDNLFLGGIGDYSSVDKFVLARMNSFFMGKRELDLMRFGIGYCNCFDNEHEVRYEDKRDGFFKNIKYREEIIFPFFTRKLKISETGGQESNLRVAIGHLDFFDDVNKIGLLKKEYFVKGEDYSIQTSFMGINDFYEFFSDKGVPNKILNSLTEVVSKNSFEDLENKVKLFL